MPTTEQLELRDRGEIARLGSELGVGLKELGSFVDTVYGLSRRKVLAYSAETGDCLTPQIGARGGIDGARTKIAAENLPGMTPKDVNDAYGKFMCDDTPRVEFKTVTVELSHTDRMLLKDIARGVAELNSTKGEN